MKKVTINLYEFKELNEKAKQKAIDEHRTFLLYIMSENDFICGESEYDTPERLHETYLSEWNNIAYNDQPVIENIESNEYYFFADGNFAGVTKYCEKHEKAGTIELKIGEEIYIVK